MSYPGNKSLADEVQKKILDTFRQTLDLAESGKREEALLGCDFVRRLDPEFELVKTLNERLEAQAGEVPVDDLRQALGDAGAGDEPKEEPTAPPEEPPAEAEQPPVTTDEAPPAAQAGGDDVFVLDLDEAGPDVESATEAAPSEDTVSDEDVSRLESALDLSSLEESQGEAGAESPDAGPAEISEEAPEAAADGEPSAALDQESESRIEQLLDEGQAAFESAGYQTAIDAWSRIFLIDIDHPEANRRIELARKLKAEIERKVEETYHDALAVMDSGSLDEAAEGFRKVLELQPNHLQAQEHLDRLSSSDKEMPSETAPVEAPPEPEPGPPTDEILPEHEAPSDEDFAAAMPDGFEYEAREGDKDLFDEEFGPAPAPKRRSSRRTVTTVAGLALVLAIAGAWFLYSNRSRFFPSAGEEEVVEPQTAPRVDPIVRAQGLHVAGNTAMAIAQLRRLPPAHPQYAEAQALIAQWETLLDVEDAEGPSEEELQLRDELVAQAREAFANREFLNADRFFTLASLEAVLDEGAQKLHAETLARLEPLQSEIEIFRQGEWSFALRSLWRKYEEDPGSPDVLQLMVAAYYNLGVRELQRGDTRAAIENLEEALSLAGGDTEVQRLLDFANTYNQRQPDLLYRIFVKYVPFRS